MKKILRLVIFTLLTMSLISCAMKYSPGASSELLQGKREFDAGYYKTAMRELLPLACSGNADAQYAVGYMYYYGYGVAQDTDVGSFWIGRSAQQNYPLALKAMEMISKECPVPQHKYKCSKTCEKLVTGCTPSREA